MLVYSLEFRDGYSLILFDDNQGKLNIEGSVPTESKTPPNPGRILHCINQLRHQCFEHQSSYVATACTSCRNPHLESPSIYHHGSRTQRRNKERKKNSEPEILPTVCPLFPSIFDSFLLFFSFSSRLTLGLLLGRCDSVSFSEVVMHSLSVIG